MTHTGPTSDGTNHEGMERGVWVNPAAGKVTLRAYATRWLDQRADLRPRTIELYEGELRLRSSSGAWRGNSP